MRDLFPGYYRLGGATLQAIWQNATFALDANVLLNLYRYPVAAREDLLAILRTLSSRLIVPHQAALEYQRNRLFTIAEQRNRFNEVRQVLDKVQKDLQSSFDELQLSRRHSSINADRLLTGISDVIKPFLTELDLLEEHHADVYGEDQIRNVLDDVLAAQIGIAPEQVELDAIYAEGKKRYETRVPPGYEDALKAKQPESVYTVNGLRIEGQFGDLIIWKQVLAAAKRTHVKNLILVTDDDKADWWWRVRGKTIGPRPELIEEARRDAEVDCFYMYNSEQFVRFSKDYLGAKVGADSIDQIGNVRRYLGSSSLDSMRAELAVFGWLRRIHSGRKVSINRGFPDYVVEFEDGTYLAYEVKLLERNLDRRLRDALGRAIAMDRAKMKRFYIVFVARDAYSERITETIISDERLPADVSVVVGHLEQADEEDDEPVFIPDWELPRPF